jgi:hypothetical protein
MPIISSQPAIALRYIHERSARCPVAHTAPKGVNSRGSNRPWMKVQWQGMPQPLKLSRIG